MKKNIRTNDTKKTNKTYSSKFLKRNAMKKRGDKSIYVNPEYHLKLTYIVKIIGEGKIPLYAYLDNILKNHFEQYAEELLEEYNKTNKLIL